ncbi:MAG TPA: dTDP-4-dehydrorhamnose 3,5-epimerase family protein [Candidatus Eisenbacteria bacterium]|nr:dTDP-4-dehydrorhamnose 3,5-epimerase family protein [Candidatus Eisenbacteria bacterium]
MVDGWEATAVPGVARRSLAAHADPRGSFTELWRESWTEPLGAPPFRQANVSRSLAGVLRGMHLHDRQDDLWIVLEGRAFVATVDLREMIAGTAAAPIGGAFELGPGSAVYIPRGVAHGFLAIDAIALAYLVTAEYDGTDEHGFAWDDRLAGVPWPTTDVTISDRDRALAGLAAAVNDARQRSGHSVAR